jgi:hypothetical protein
LSAAVHALHVPAHALPQHTPSAQKVEVQSVPALHAVPLPHLVAHPPPPPQSTPVSLPSFIPLLQLTVPPQPSAPEPQVRPSCAQVLGVHPHEFATPPPAQVCGAMHCAFPTHWTQWVAPSHTVLLGATLHDVPEAVGVKTVAPIEQLSAVHALPSFGTSPSSETTLVAPAPSHCTTLQSPLVCEATGSMAPFATFAVEQTWPEQTAFTHTGGCGHSLAVLHCTHAPMPSQYFEPEHTVSIAEGGFAGTPFEQTSSVHSTPSTGLSPLSATLFVAPFPSHTTFWQSPALCAAVAVPTAV